MKSGLLADDLKTGLDGLAGADFSPNRTELIAIRQEFSIWT